MRAASNSRRGDGARALLLAATARLGADAVAGPLGHLAVHIASVNVACAVLDGLATSGTAVGGSHADDTRPGLLASAALAITSCVGTPFTPLTELAVDGASMGVSEGAVAESAANAPEGAGICA